MLNVRRFACALAAAGAIFVSSSAMAQWTEQFEDLPSTTTLGAPPGTPLPLATGTWFVHNASTPLGVTGVSRAPSVAGGSTPFAVNPGDGTWFATMNFNNGAGLATINNFLMTPELTLQNDDTLSFITRGPTSQTFPDRLRVVMSTNGASTSPADFSTILLSINEGLAPAYPNVWTSFTATVSGLAGATSGRLAFNYNVPNGGPSGANSNLIGIDRATYTPIPEPASLGLLAGAGFLALRRRSA